MEIRKLCVFCGSSPGTRSIYAEKAGHLGREMVNRGIDLVYGGGGVGLMGIVADSVLKSGGNVTGVIPYALATKERALETTFNDRVELRVVRTMHERKAIMVSLSDAFVALPGGYGTFDELFEALTWGQLGIHKKPLGVLNVESYFDPLISMIDRGIEEGFVRPRFRDLIIFSNDVNQLLDGLKDYRAPESIVQWVEMDEV